MSATQPVDRLAPSTVVASISRRWYLVVLCVLVAPFVAYQVSASKPDRYEATASLLFEDRAATLGLGDVTPLQSQVDSTEAAATNRDLLELGVVSERTANALQKSVTDKDVRANVETGVTGESNVYSVAATGTDPVATARLANAYASEFVEFRRQTKSRGFKASIATLRQQIKSSLARNRSGPIEREQRAKLRGQIANLRTAASLADGGVRVLEPAEVPGSPFEPKPGRDAAIGGGVGLLLGLALAILFGVLDRRLRTLQSVQSAFDRPVLAAIPKSRGLARGGKGRKLSPSDREAFRMLRANLRYYNDDRNVNTVLVTSAQLGEGKSTVAWNLTMAGADAGARVLLIEADLRRPVFAKRSEAGDQPGLSDVLQGHAEVKDVVRRVAIGEPNGHSNPGMDVIFGGPPLSNPVDPIESERMEHLIRDARKEYDLVVIDSPPVSVVADAIPLIRSVDGVLVVSRIGVATPDSVAHLQEQLDSLGAPALGIVVNDVRKGDGEYRYAYATVDALPPGRTPDDD